MTSQIGLAVRRKTALDHTIVHLDADLRWLETAAARIAPKGKVRT